MISDRFVFLAISLNVIGSSDYLIKTARGLVKPNRVTWLLWAFVPLIAFSGQLSSGVGLQSLQTLAAGLLPLAIFCASFLNAHAYWRLNSLDYGCAVASIAAIAVWVVTADAGYAILLSVVADALAATPTIVKSVVAPETENALTYLCAIVSAAITLLIVPHWDVPHAAFPSYLFAISTLLFLLTARRRTVPPGLVKPSRDDRTSEDEQSGGVQRLASLRKLPHRLTHRFLDVADLVG